MASGSTGKQKEDWRSLTSMLLCKSSPMPEKVFKHSMAIPSVIFCNLQEALIGMLLRDVYRKNVSLKNSKEWKLIKNKQTKRIGKGWKEPDSTVSYCLVSISLPLEAAGVLQGSLPAQDHCSDESLQTPSQPSWEALPCKPRDFTGQREEGHGPGEQLSAWGEGDALVYSYMLPAVLLPRQSSRTEGKRSHLELSKGFESVKSFHKVQGNVCWYLFPQSQPARWPWNNNRIISIHSCFPVDNSIITPT